MPLFVYFGDLTCTCAVSTILQSGLKSNVTFEFSAAVYLYGHGNFRRATPLSATFVAIMSAHAQ